MSWISSIIFPFPDAARKSSGQNKKAKLNAAGQIGLNKSLHFFTELERKKAKHKRKRKLKKKEKKERKGKNKREEKRKGRWEREMERGITLLKKN